MFRFVQRLFDFMDQSAAVSFAFSQDALNVFGIDADSGDSGFHRFVFSLLNKDLKTKRISFGRDRVVP